MVRTVDRKVKGVKRDDEAYEIPDELVPPFPVFGRGLKAMITGMTHTDDYRIEPEDDEVHQRLVKRLSEKVIRNRKDINRTELTHPGSKTMIVSYGASALGPMEVASQHASIGLLRLKSIWPLPEEPIAEAARECEQMLVCEMNLGQLYGDIKRVALEAGCRKIELLSKIGGEPPTPRDVKEKLGQMGAL